MNEGGLVSNTVLKQSYVFQVCAMVESNSTIAVEAARHREKSFEYFKNNLERRSLIVCALFQAVLFNLPIYN